MPKPFVLSDETAQMVRYLGSIEKGVHVTYRELAEIIGSKISQSKLTSARRILQRDHNAVGRLQIQVSNPHGGLSTLVPSCPRGESSRVHQTKIRVRRFGLFGGSVHFYNFF